MPKHKLTTEELLKGAENALRIEVNSAPIAPGNSALARPPVRCVGYRGGDIEPELEAAQPVARG